MNTFGHTLKLSLFGESHGQVIGITLDGCPAGLKIDTDEFNTDLARRKSGKIGTTPRKELDQPEFISGIYKSYTTGAPITMIFRNENINPKDYEAFKRIPRPGHADFTAYKKYNGFNDPRGGGPFSGRLTLGLVAAGVIAKKLIFPLFVNAELIEAGGDKNIERAVKKALKANDTIGGVIECKSKNVPVGLGEPFFNKIQAVISHLVMSIPAIKGIEFGSGFHSAKMKGSEHNDSIIDKTGRTETNYAGGTNGGITNGNNLEFRVPVKPTSSTPQKQKTINMENEKIEELEVKGRHDACIALRVPVIIEAVTAFALADFMLQEQRIPRVFES